VPALFFLTRVLRPVIRVMEAAAKGLVRVLGVEPRDELASQFTAEEVAHIVDESHREGLVPEERYARLGAALEFSDKDAADVAVPLTELVTVGVSATPADIERLVSKRGFSRYPVADGSGDLHGYLHLKDVLYADDEERDQPVPRKRVRRMATVRPVDEVEDVLETMRATGSHLARVVEADGRVLGVVFLEDVIEELVGEVSDSTQR
jgi:CBS domain containing-hemolysin-like protein